MENLIFSLNATVPVFLMMILGLVFKKIGWIDDIFASKMNKFVFMVPLPVLVFEDLATVDFSKVWDVKFVLFCFIVTMISITISFLISCLLGDKTIRGEFIQAAYRSSAALLGIAFIQNMLRCMLSYLHLNLLRSDLQIQLSLLPVSSFPL